MSFKNETKGTENFLVYTIDKDAEVEDISMGMLINNNIPGFIKTGFSQIDDTKILKYNITSKANIKNLFSGVVRRETLLAVFSSIIDASILAEEYMINPEMIICDTDYIYIDLEKKEIDVICLPVKDKVYSEMKIWKFIKDVMYRSQFDQTENCDHVALIMNYLNSAKELSIYEFKNIITSLITNAPMPVAKKPVVQPAPKAAPGGYNPNSAPIPQRPVTPEVREPVYYAPPQQEYTGGETTVIGRAVTAVADTATAVSPVPIPTPVPTPAPAPTPAPKAVAHGVEIPGKKAKQQAGEKEPEDKKKPLFGFPLFSGKEKEEKKKEIKEKASAKKKEVKEKAEKKKTEVTSNKKPSGFAIPGTVTPEPVKAGTGGAAKSAKKTASASELETETPNSGFQAVYEGVAPNSGVAMNFGETTVLGSNQAHANGGETTVLNVKPTQRYDVVASLIRKRTGEKTIINKPRFMIGKERSFADYFIGSNTAISRAHAEIITKPDGFYIVDKNSTNHTYVDGKMIPPEREIKIKSGCVVRLADEDFIFSEG